MSYIYNNKKFSEKEIQERAKSLNMTVDQYKAKNKKVLKPAIPLMSAGNDGVPKKNWGHPKYPTTISNTIPVVTNPKAKKDPNIKKDENNTLDGAIVLDEVVVQDTKIDNDNKVNVALDGGVPDPDLPKIDLPDENFDAGFLSDLKTVVDQGIAQGKVVDPLIDVIQGDLSRLQEYIELSNAMQGQPQTHEMLKFQEDTQKYMEKYDTEGDGGIFDGLRAGVASLIDNPGVGAQTFASSIAGMASTAWYSAAELISGGDADVLKISGTSAAAGGAIGMGYGSLGGNPVTVAAGTLGGSMYGAFGGFMGAMEGALRFDEILRAELGEGNFNETKIIELFNDPDKVADLRNRAIASGVTIAFADLITMGLSAKAVNKLGSVALRKGISAPVRTVAGGITAVGTEAAGAGVGEAGAQLIATGKLEPTDIVLEMFSEHAVPGPSAIKGVINMSKTPVYKVNGGKLDRKALINFINDPKNSNLLAEADIDISNDPDMQVLLESKQQDAVLMGKLDPRVTDPIDTQNLFNLEKELQELKKRDTRSAKNRQTEVEGQIDEITNKYNRRGRLTSDAKAKAEAKERIENAEKARGLKASIEFAKKQGSLINTETKVETDVESFQEQYNNTPQGKKESKSKGGPQDVRNLDGFYDPQTNTIIINEVVARDKKSINVGYHELEHAIIEKHMADPDNAARLVTEFNEFIGPEESQAVIDEMRRRGYNESEYNQETFTIFSEMIRDGKIKFNEDIFTKIGDLIRPILRAAGFGKLEFSTGRDVYNFLREYDQSIKTGELSEGIIELATGEKPSKGDIKASLSADQNADLETLKTTGTDTDFLGDPTVADMIGKVTSAAVNRFFKGIPTNILQDVGLTESEYRNSAKTDLQIIALNWDPTKQAFDKYLANLGMTRLSGLATDLGVPPTAQETKVSLDELQEKAGVEPVADDAPISVDNDKQRVQVGKIRGLLGINSTDPLYQIVLDGVKKVFPYETWGLSQPTQLGNFLAPRHGKKITDPKKIKKYIQDQYTIEFAKEIKKIIGTQKSKKFKEFISNPDNIRKLIEALALPYRNRFPMMSENGGRMNVNESIKSQTTLGGSFVTNEKAGNTIWIPNFNIDPQEFGNFFIQGRETQYKSLVNALASELGKDATIQALKENEGTIPMAVESKIGEVINRDPQILFSKNDKNDTKLLDEVLIKGDAILDEFTKQPKTLPGLVNALNIALSDTVFSPDQIKKLAKRIIKPAVRYFGEKVYPIVKNAKPYGKFIIDGINLNEAQEGRDIISLLGIQEKVEAQKDEKGKPITKFRSMDGLFNNPLFIDNIRSSHIEIRDNLLGKNPTLESKRKTIETVLKFFKPFQATAGKIGQGRYQVYDGLPGLIDELIKSIPGVTVDYETRISERGKKTTVINSIKIENKDGINEEVYSNGKIDDKPVNQPSFDKEKLTSEYDARKKEAREAWDFVVQYLQHFKDKNDPVGFAMALMSLKSNMTSPLKTAAVAEYFYIGDKLPTNQLRFEHMLPSDYVALQLAESIWNENPDVNTDNLFDDYKVAVIPKTMDNVLNVQLQKTIPLDVDNHRDRYYSDITEGYDNMFAIEAIGGENKGKKYGENWVNNTDTKKSLNNNNSINPIHKDSDNIAESISKLQNLDKALEIARDPNAPEKGITVMDFDGTLAITKESVLYTMPDGKKGKLTAKQFADKVAELTAAGAVFDFSEFTKVVNAKKGPLFDVTQQIKKKFGNKDIFILTARPPEAAPAIQKFLKSIGLDIKLENITGLEDGTAQAKAQWILDKAAEGYNNFLFGDDIYKNVKAVQDVLDVVDVKRDVKQAKINFSKSLDDEVNKIIEENEGLGAEKRYSRAKAKSVGQAKDPWYQRIFIPPSAEDFAGLLYFFAGVGKKGEQQLAFFKKSLIDPFARGIRDLNAAREVISNDFRALKDKMPDVKKRLRKKSGYGNFSFDQAIRVYLWDKNGIDVPGLSKADAQALSTIVEKDPRLKQFADKLGQMTKLKEGYTTPDDNWLIGNTSTDILDVNNKINRAKYLKEFLDNASVIFSESNLNKMEAAYGSKFREAMEDILWRMEYGTNRNFGQNALMNQWTKWVNNSVGAIMFLNTRSAVLQTLSSINFMNWSDNNPMQAAKAFANQPQFWSDFAMIFNSPTLRQRRSGLGMDVNGSEIAQHVQASTNPASSALAWMLQKGFIATQMADSFAIAIGGASMYRNRLNTYLKQGLSEKQAQERAWFDFQEISEATQQSARPDMISSQQAGPLGRLVLAFQNTPMQYARLIKKAALDIKNGRGDFKTNVSKIAYYGAVQNLVFNALQNALFQLMFKDDEEEMTEKEERALIRTVNNMSDSLLRGMGVYGAAISTVKNMAIKFMEQEKRGYRADHAYTVIEGINLSPPIGSKARKVYSATQTWKYNKDAIMEMGFDIDNPAYSAVGNLVSGTTNIPLDRVVNKVNNIRAGLDKQNEAWQRIATLMGWNAWSVDIPNREVEGVKADIKKRKAEEKKRKREEEKRKKKKK